MGEFRDERWNIGVMWSEAACPVFFGDILAFAGEWWGDLETSVGLSNVKKKS